MGEAYFLSAEDVKIVKELLAAYRRGVVPSGLRSPTDSTYALGMDDISPEVHLAKLNLPQQSSIEVRDDNDPVLGEKAGEGLIDIYRIDPTSGQISKSPTNQRDIWNPFDVKPSNDYIIIARTKYGAWVPIPTPKDFNFVRFKIIEMRTDSSGTYAYSIIENRQAGATSSPGEDPYGNIEVYDKLGCVFDEPDADLVDRVGYASYMADASYGSGSNGQWEVVSLCCPPA